MKFLNIFKATIPIFAHSHERKEGLLHCSLNNLYFCSYCLKNHINYKFNLLACISGVDNLISKYRFNIVYDFLSIIYNTRIRVKVYLNSITPVISLTGVFVNANWWEREIWDLFGIYFTKHPDLRRILTDYGFEGYPLRKDFPISGFLETRYELSKRQVVQESLELAQSYRFFNFEMPW